MENIDGAFSKLVEMVEKLRSEEGCPWDREQKIEDWMRFLKEEVEELEEGINRKDWENIKEELGDVLFLVVMIAQVCREEMKFTINDVLAEIISKVERRHPHVFGEMKASSAEEALEIFYKMKAMEKQNKKTIKEYK